MARTAREVALTPGLRDVLSANVASRTCGRGLSYRSDIVLGADEGLGNDKIAARARVHENTVSLWRGRFADALPALAEVEADRPGELADAVAEVLSDRPRPGRPRAISKDVRDTLCAIACDSPADHGVEGSVWTLPTLSVALVATGVIDSISLGAVHAILTTADIKPWLNQYWLRSKERFEDYDAFRDKISTVNGLYLSADALLEQGTRLWCVDEMTCIRARERVYADKWALPGSPCKREFNYIKHGVTTLIGFFDVQRGKMFEDPYLKQTRTSEDFVEALGQVVDSDPDKKHVVVADNI